MGTPERIEIDVNELRATFGFGVAGNFAGHLEQAGEAADFTSVHAAPELPKGIFPWYAPGATNFLGDFPLSSDTVGVPAPAGDAPLRMQIEPELGVLCDVLRDDTGAVTSLTPRWVAAFDDCSLRRPGAAKISEKKNWGDGSKGLAATGFQVADIDPCGTLATMRLACFLRRDGITHAYGVDSAIPTYTLFGEPLLAWLVDRLGHQRAAENTPLEDVGALLAASAAPHVLIGVGATRYTPFGETNFLEPGDEAIVVVYDSSAHQPDAVADLIADRRNGELRGASVLRRLAAPIDAVRPHPAR